MVSPDTPDDPGVSRGVHRQWSRGPLGFARGGVVVVVPVVGWEPHSGRVACDLHSPRVSPVGVEDAKGGDRFRWLPFLSCRPRGGGGCVV